MSDIKNPQLETPEVENNDTSRAEEIIRNTPAGFECILLKRPQSDGTRPYSKRLIITDFEASSKTNGEIVYFLGKYNTRTRRFRIDAQITDVKLPEEFSTIFWYWRLETEADLKSPLYKKAVQWSRLIRR
jgi:hypothetical protein